MDSRIKSHTVCVGLEVIGNTTKESLLTEMNTQHADDRASLQVTNVIENLIDFEGVPNGHLDGVRSSQRVEVECLLNTFSL